MIRHLVPILAGLLLALPAGAHAQGQSDRERERVRAEEARDRERERLRDARERDREQREHARAERDRERERERRLRDAAGTLDTLVAFDARGAVAVSCPGGSVLVTAWDRSEIRVQARTRNGAIRFTSSGSRASLEPATGRGCSDGRFEVTVPAGSRVTANTWSGSISIRGVSGDIEAHAHSGDIEVRDAGGRLEAESLSGDLTVSSVTGDLSLQSVSGDITVAGARGAVEVETVSGDTELRDVTAGQVRTSATSGDVSFTGRIVPGGRYEFNTHSGDVHLTLPAGIGAQLSVSTYSGGIESDIPITLQPGDHGIGAAQAKRLNFTLGQGSARITAETFSGDIILKTIHSSP